MEITVDKLVYESPKMEHGFTVKAYYLKEPNETDALVEIFKDDEPYKRFLYPAYKVWNIAAHWGDIVQSEINNDFRGYDLAGWDGLGSVTRPRPVAD